MKRLLIAILIVSMVQGVFAQKIEIKGTIRNATDNEATEFVNVVLQTTDSVFVNGVSTNNNGSFIFNKVELPIGSFLCWIQHTIHHIEWSKT